MGYAHFFPCSAKLATTIHLTMATVVQSTTFTYVYYFAMEQESRERTVYHHRDLDAEQERDLVRRLWNGCIGSEGHRGRMPKGRWIGERLGFSRGSLGRLTIVVHP